MGQTAAAAGSAAAEDIVAEDTAAAEDMLPSKWKYWCGGCKCCAGLRYLLRRRRRQVLLLILLLRLLRRHVLRLSHIRQHRDRVRLAPVQVVSVDRRCQAQRRQRRQEMRRKVGIPDAALGSADVPKPRVPRWASVASCKCTNRGINASREPPACGETDAERY